jgi:Zn-dependent M28 family amino/carboxypeptidase
LWTVWQTSHVTSSSLGPGSPGASDDGAGVAALCAVARALVARPPLRPSTQLLKA